MRHVPLKELDEGANEAHRRMTAAGFDIEIVERDDGKFDCNWSDHPDYGPGSRTGATASEAVVEALKGIVMNFPTAIK